MRNIFRNLPITRNLSKVSVKEKRYWVPMLMGIGLSIILFGLTTIRSEGLGSWVGWFTLANGVGMFSWGALWSKHYCIVGGKMMAFTIEFLYENGEPVKQLDDEVLDEDKVKEILRLRPVDTITLGREREKVNLRVVRIKHDYVDAEHSDTGEEKMHHKFTVEAI